MKNDSLMLSLKKIAPKESDIHLERKILKRNCKLHFHDYFEIEFILSGNVVEYVNGKEYQFHTNTMYFVSPSDFHELIIKEDTEILTVNFNYDILPLELFNYLSTHQKFIYMELNESKASFVKELLLYMISVYEEKSPYYKTILQNSLSIMLSFFMEQLDLSNEYHSQQESNAITIAINYLRMHFQEHITLEKISSLVFLSPTYFSKVFKEETSKNFNTFLTELRISYSKQLLFIDNLTIIDIAMASGFNSLNSFIRNFKKITGYAPMQYKKLKSTK